jgi:formyl-CoA transferase
MTLFGGIMLALYERTRTGRGIKVSTSLMANGAWSNACLIQAAICGASFRQRWTRADAINPLVNHYVTRDGVRFFFCVLDPAKDWTNFSRALERPELMYDPRFSTPEARIQNSPALIAIIDEVMAGKDAAEWRGIFAEHEVIWSPVPESTDVPGDAQMSAAGVFVPMEGGLRTVSNPLNLEGVEKVVPRTAPTVGQHSREILREIGYGEEQVERLIGSGVVSAGEKKTGAS